MSLSKIFVVLILGISVFCSSVEAEIVTTLDFRSGGEVGAAFDMGTVVGTPVSANITAIPGLTITALGAATDTTAVLNATADRFGINSAGADDSDGFETNFGESITFTFNQDVTILDIEFEDVDDSADSTDVIEFGGVSLPGTDLGSGDTFTFSPPLFFAAGAPVLLQEISGNGFALQSFTIEVSAVPEPGSLALFGLGSVLVMARRRRR